MRSVLGLLLFATMLRAADTYVVAVGVETYDDTGIARLAYGDEDAKAVADAFRAAGVSDDHVIVLISGDTAYDKRPTRANVLAALQRTRERCHEQDTLVFYFSGHGMQKDQPYLLTVDARRELLEDTALPMRLVNASLRDLSAGTVLFIVDACRNDPDSGKANVNAALDENFAKGVRPRLTRAAGREPTVAVMLACDVGERAWEMPDAGHGAFTSFLLKALSGEARAGNGSVRLQRLFEYVQREVTAWCGRAGHLPQRPRLDNPSNADLLVLPPGSSLRAEAELTVATTPPKAQVFVKGPNDATGRLSGTTPAKLTLAPGAETKVVLMLRGYGREERLVRLGRGQVGSWIVTLNPAAPAQTIARGTLELRSSPAGATVSLNGRELGPTPATLVLPPGQLVFGLRFPDHADGEVVASIEKDKVAAPEPVTLKPLPAMLELTTQPDGAKVSVDGKPTDSVTPCVLRLEPGRHPLVFELADHEPAPLEVTLYPNESVRQAPVTMRPMPASVEVSSDPAGLRVLVDGKDTGQQTPCTLALPPGTPKLRVVGDALGAHEEKLDLKPGQRVKLPTWALVGRLHVQSDPAGARVLVDGRETDQVTPCLVVLPGGPVVLKVAHPEGGEHEAKVVVALGQTQELPVWPLVGRLRVQSDPAGARVLVDGRETGQVTPCLLVLPGGPVALKLVHPEGGEHEAKVVVALGQTQELPVWPLRGSILVSSQPPGAAVSVDGNATGHVTPCRIAVPPGERVISVVLANYEPATRRAPAVAGKEATCDFAALKPLAGTIALNTEPTGASVSIDGTATGKRTPCVLTAAVGDHTVRLQLARYDDTVVTVAVMANGRSDVPLIRLVGRFGVVRLQTDRQDARVFLNGTDTGLHGSCELTVDPGNAALRVEAPGMMPFNVTLEVRQGGVHNLQVTLVPLLGGTFSRSWSETQTQPNQGLGELTLTWRHKRMLVLSQQGDVITGLLRVEQITPAGVRYVNKEDLRGTFNAQTGVAWLERMKNGKGTGVGYDVRWSNPGMTVLFGRDNPEQLTRE